MKHVQRVDRREVQKTVNDKRPHANMLRAGQFTAL